MKKGKEKLSKFIIYIIGELRKFNKKIIEEVNEMKGYEALSAKDDIGEQYFDEIDIAIGNKDLKNIAFGGPYGAGKSSILKSYMNQREEYKFMTISLANFENTKVSKNQAETNSDVIDDGKTISSSSDSIPTNKIEEQILKQIFYRVNNSKIPYSRYQKINNLKKSYLIGMMAALVGGGLCYLLIFNPQFFVNMEKQREIFNSLGIENIGILKYFNIKNHHVLQFIKVVFISICAAILVKSVEFSKQSFRLNKISVNKTEISKDISDQHVFDKNIDEILYFFEVNKYDVVIFEDIDRFDNIEIFVKLRELNDLINNYQQINRKVTFIYAMKEDMFDDGKSRTKFFDFIIPVIPYINSSNSIEILNKKLEDNELNKYLTSDFINDITIYIDDMRILNNIFNEFIMYRKHLKDAKLNMDKLLGMIVYKNIYPQDFAKLQYNSGMVGDIFENRNYIYEIIKDMDEELKQLENDLERANKEITNNIEELKSIYIDYLDIDRSNSIYKQSGYYSSTSISYNDFKEYIFEEDVDLEENINYHTHSNDDKNIKIKDILTSEGNKENYHNRKIHLKHKDNREMIKAKIYGLKHRRDYTKLSKVKDLIEVHGLDSVITKQETRREKLIVYLIRNGYIDEMYNSYLTYFHEGSLTKNDMEFVQSVKNHEPLPFEYKLTNKSKIVERLNFKEFQSKEILNYDLLNFIITNNVDYRNEYSSIIRQLSNEESNSIEFIDGYLKVVKDKEIFIRTLCSNWLEICEYIIKKSNYPQEKIDEYIFLFIEYLEATQLSHINKNDVLSEYISNKGDFLSVAQNKINSKKIKEIVSKLEVKFNQIDTKDVDTEIMKHIYISNLYTINYDMIELFIGVYGRDVNLEDLQIKNYTTIKQSGCGNLIEYINRNIEYYVEDVLLKLEYSLEDSEEDIVDLLNSEQNTRENKIDIIEKQKTLISDISKVDSWLFSFIFNMGKVVLDWFNIAIYLSSKQVNEEELVKIFNDIYTYKQLSKEVIDAEEYTLDEDEINNIFDYIFIKLNISTDSFKYLAHKIRELYEIYLDKEDLNKKIEENISNITEDKLSILIDLKIINLSTPNYEYIKGQCEEKHLKLIEDNIEEYKQNSEEYKFNSFDISKLLKSETIGDSEKEFIINNSDIVNILGDDIYNDLEKELVLYLIKTDKKVNVDLLKYILNSDIDRYNKIYILSNNIEVLDEDNISRALEKLGEEYACIIERGKRPAINNNTYNNKLLDALEKKGYISSYSIIDEDKVRVYNKKVVNA